MTFIPISRPDLNGNELDYVIDAVQSSWISSTGKYVTRFEQEFAKFCGASQAVSTSNGTTALHVALAALGIGPGQKVIVPSLSFVATANAVRYTGAEPVFVDVDPKTWCIDPQQIELAATKYGCCGMIPVHLYGNPCNMHEIMKIAAGHNMWVIEDAAQAHGAQFDSRPVGSIGNLGTFSFYGNKTITCGEGGVVVDSTGIYANQLRLLRGQGMDLSRRYYHPVIGYNYRLTNIACALLCAQLERFHEFAQERTFICEVYRAELDDIGMFQEKYSYAETSPWMSAVVFESREHQQAVVASLEADNVETRPFFEPIHTFPMYKKDDIELPTTEKLARNGLCLPTFFGMTQEELSRVIRRVRAA